jgi:arabinofuranosyltransferase
MEKGTTTLRSSSKDGMIRAAILVGLGAIFVIGALQLALITDDAYITFRYVSNAHDGLGLVWNQPPFKPVEGYSSFLWAASLWAALSWFGVEPPQSANAISILYGLALFAVVAFTAFRIEGRHGKRLSHLAVLCTLAAVVSNRTFLQWTTGGLGTSLFGLCFVTWVVMAFRGQQRRTTRWLVAWATAAALAALARPDGLLLVAATIGATGWAVVARNLKLRTALLALTPLLAVATHLLWHRWFYGEFLPNTYYAKVSTPWPEAGVRYLGCFCFENAGWLWAPLAAVWVVVEIMRQRLACIRPLLGHIPAVAAVTATLGHTAYYTLRVGGDPFGFRVLSALIPLGALSAAAMATRIRSGSLLPIVCTLALGLASTVSWVHLALTEPKLTVFYQPLHAKMPSWLQPAWRWHDRTMAWLQIQVLCGRRHLHAMFLEGEQKKFPARQRTEVDPNDRPVAVFTGVGYAGWALPDYAIIDRLGLNDYVAARTPIERGTWVIPEEILVPLLALADANGDTRTTREELRIAFGSRPNTSEEDANYVVEFILLLFALEDGDALSKHEVEKIAPTFATMRFMAHDRRAPADYINAFDPNVTVKNGKSTVRQRATPLTHERVRTIETEWRERLKNAAGK